MASLDHKRQIAERLSSLSVKRLEFNEVPKNYIALTVGTTPYKNAITVSKAHDRVSFYVENNELLDEIGRAGFRLELTNQGYGYNKSRYWVYEVGPSDIDRHQVLFGKLVAEAVQVMVGRRSKKQ
jgi:hypothetical protein